MYVLNISLIKTHCNLYLMFNTLLFILVGAWAKVRFVRKFKQAFIVTSDREIENNNNSNTKTIIISNDHYSYYSPSVPSPSYITKNENDNNNDDNNNQFNNNNDNNNKLDHKLVFASGASVGYPNFT